MNDDNLSAQHHNRGTWPQRIAWSVAAMMLGTGMGLVTGLVWLREARSAHDACVARNAVNPESYCGLGYGLFIRPVMVLVAAATASLVVWLLLTVGTLRPRLGIVAMVPVLVIASGYAFEALGRFDALDDPAAWRIWAPTAVLGTGLPAMSMIVRLHRDRWNWRDRLMPAQPRCSTGHASTQSSRRADRESR